MWFKAHSTNQYRFTIQSNGTYTPYPGVKATITHIGATYILTTTDQSTYTFNSTGHLMDWADAQGHQLVYQNNVLGQPITVTEASSQRYLAFSYDGQNRIIAVADQTGRHVDYGYDVTTGDLITMTDVLGQNWTYTYSNSTHLLTAALDPRGVSVMHTDYDAQGRAWRQLDANGQALVQIGYNLDGTRVITDARGITQIHAYDDRNTLTYVVGAQGSSTQKTYDYNFKPTVLLDSLGHPLTMTWSDNGADLTQVSDALGHATQLSYDSRNNLTRTVDALGFATSFAYTGTLLTVLTDTLSNSTRFTYTIAATDPGIPVGLLKASSDSLGRITSYQYDTLGQLVRITDTAGLVTTYGYDELGRVITTTSLAGTAREQITINAYDAAGQLLQVTRNYTSTSAAQNYAAGGSVYNTITRYQYDAVGNQVAVTDTLGLVTLTEYDPNNRAIAITTTTSAGAVQDLTRMRYDANGSVISTTVHAQALSLAQTTVTGYDALNRPVTTTTNYVDGVFDVGAPDKDVTTVTTYDAVGNATAVASFYGTALARTSTTGYDPLNRPVTTTTNYVDGVFDANEPDEDVLSLTRYDANGNVISTTAYANIPALAVTTLTEYDRLNRPVTTTTAAGTAFALTSLTAYNAAGQVISTTEAYGTSQARTSYMEYDAAGRPVTTTANYDGTGVPGPDRNLQQVTVYGPAGERSASAERRVAADGAVTWITTTYSYNNQGQLIQTTWPLTAGVTASNSQAYDALGRVVTQTDELGRLTVTQYDALGRPVTVTVNYVDGVYSGAQPDTDLTTLTTYDAAGNRVQTQDPKGILTRFGYDLLGQLTSVVENFGAFGGQAPVTTTYRYDAAGNLLTITDGRGKVSTFTYDLLGRQVSATDPLTHTAVYTYNAASQQTAMLDPNGQVISYSYDLVGRQTGIDYPGSTPDVSFGYDLLGQRTVMTDGTGTTTWAYDLAGRPITITQPGLGAPVVYAYDSASARTGLQYPDGKVVTYTFDLANRLVNLTDWQALTTRYVYDAAGQLSTTSLPNGVTSTYGYDSAYRLTSIAHQGLTQTVGVYTYTVDAAGQRTAVQEIMAVEAPAAPPPAPVNTITVTVSNDELNSDGDCSLREAVRAAYLNSAVDACRAGSSVDPDKILLAAGTYTLSVAGTGENASLTGDLDLGGRLILAGAGLTQTTIAANNVDRVLQVLSGAQVTVQDLTLKGGKPESFASGGGIYVSGALTLTNVTVYSNTADYGGGLYINGGQVTVITATIHSNTTPAQGAGVYVTGAGAFTLLDGFIRNNTYAYGAGVYVQQGTAILAGGQITANAGIGLVVGTTSNLSAQALISGTTIAGHIGDIDGIGVSIRGTQTVVTMTAGVIRSNDARTMHAGAGMFVDGGARVYMSGGEIYTNTARTGGGVQVGNGTFELAGGNIWYNRATYQGGGVYLSSTSSRFIQTAGENSYNTSNNDGGGAVVYGNYTLAGGRLGNNLTQSGNGGGIFVGWGTLTQTGGLIAENGVWGIGGGIYSYQGNVRLLGGAVAYNWAYTGGGIYLVNNSSAVISGSVIYNNYATVEGAGLDLYSGSAVISNTTISGNYANGNGGGLLVAGGTATLKFVSVVSNTTDYDNNGTGNGGGLYRSAGTLNFANTLLGYNVDKGNQAPNCNGTVTSQDYNLIQSTTGCTVTGTTTHNVTGSDPKVDPLADNGGATLTHALRSDSPAIDAATNTACPAVDQRGNGRPVDGNGDSTATCDIGAYEYQGAGGFYRAEQYRVLSAADSIPSLLPPAAQAARPRASVILTGTAISYTYDALYRLTRADYTNGQYFAYTYDEVGNRTSEVACAGTPCAPITTTYSYDDANRLIAVDGQPYTWDANGNLRFDGVLTYTYDAANRLIGTTDGLTTTTYNYNGLGDRVNQVVHGVVTTYTLDLAAGLTQVLADGTFTYLYGNGRVAQATVTQTAYFLGDALGSIRHLVDSAGQVTLARSYEPYGDVLTSAGSGVTSYSFTGEWRDGSGLIYLRARYYASGVGRFVTRDTWMGDRNSPGSLNTWAYGANNPVLNTDPSGHCLFTPVDALICIEVADLVIAAALTGLVVWYAYLNANQNNVIDTCDDVLTDAEKFARDFLNGDLPEAPLDYLDPLPVPLPGPFRYAPRQASKERRENSPRVLILGENNNFSYSMALIEATRALNWSVDVTQYDGSTNRQVLKKTSDDGRLRWILNVDGRNLQTGTYTANHLYDAIIFNGVRADKGWDRETAILINDILATAHLSLKPGGHIRFGSGGPKYPATGTLDTIIANGVVPTGYSSMRQTPYLLDLPYGLPYKARRNDGTDLKADFGQWTWTIFNK
ncbi:MAG: hypothetical protein IT318_24510 [Anaerolineales bacterium]|nr:hypothetical protein [Anaerolineales bacterium]